MTSFEKDEVLVSFLTGKSFSQAKDEEGRDLIAEFLELAEDRSILALEGDFVLDGGYRLTRDVQLTSVFGANIQWTGKRDHLFIVEHPFASVCLLSMKLYDHAILPKNGAFLRFLEGASPNRSFGLSVDLNMQGDGVAIDIGSRETRLGSFLKQG